MYRHITLKKLRPSLPWVIHKIDSELERYIISKRGEPVAIMLSFNDYESLIETLNETLDKKNLARIQKGLLEAKNGKTVSWKKIKQKLKV